MIHALIGHRGVGKTSLLKRIKSYIPECEIFCLDEEIEKKHGSIKAIFRDKGEPAFRELEQETLLYLTQSVFDIKKNIYISIGAGYLRPLPTDWHKIWIRRNVDLAQFIFLDRPSLSKNSENLFIPQDLFLKREKYYSTSCDEHFFLREGSYNYLSDEEVFFTNKINSIGGVLTFLPQHLSRPNFFRWLKQRDEWGFSAFEIRNDLLSIEQVQKIIDSELATPLLYSFRHLKCDVELSQALKCKYVDWDSSLGQSPTILHNKEMVLSFHTQEESFEFDLKRLNLNGVSIKWSPLIHSFSDLELGHDWMMKAPSQRFFLPRSNDGRWQWYRLLMKNKMRINFLREDDGSSLDQPHLLDWLSMNSTFRHQAGIVGDPVTHSWSPVFHKDFFTQRSMNFLSIPIKKSDMRASTMTFLQFLGFHAFAVTSPHKKFASEICGNSNSTNTLVWDCFLKKWKGFTTDMQGFQQGIKNVDVSTKRIAVWGSGAMAEDIHRLYSEAIVFSGRTGMSQESIAEDWSPQIVIWSAGDSGYETIMTMKPDWRPELVLDLNYRLDSPAILFAHNVGARYVSGKDMFFAQGQEQQKIWQKELIL